MDLLGEIIKMLLLLLVVIGLWVLKIVAIRFCIIHVFDVVFTFQQAFLLYVLTHLLIPTPSSD